MTALFEQGDREGTRNIAHALKGSAGNLRVTGLTAAATALNNELRKPAAAGDQERILPLIAEVGRHLQHLAALMEDPPSGN
jgi:HPt (histidine-containing phosphotransfer) domain-containing protein